MYIKPNRKNTMKIKKNIDIGTQNGENTHHQDQSMLLVNFKVRNIRNKIVDRPIPLLVV
jgi:hypothetical protein